jgi:hypothetical protein
MSISWDTALEPMLLVLQEVWPIRRSTELLVRTHFHSSCHRVGCCPSERESGQCVLDTHKRMVFFWGRCLALGISWPGSFSGVWRSMDACALGLPSTDQPWHWSKAEFSIEGPCIAPRSIPLLPLFWALVVDYTHVVPSHISTGKMTKGQFQRPCGKKTVV